MVGEVWFPDVNDPYVESNHLALARPRVRNLFKPRETVWDHEVVSDPFKLRDQWLILSPTARKRKL